MQCPLCNQGISDKPDHFQRCLQRQKITKSSQYSLEFIDGRTYCIRCMLVFSDKQRLVIHRKSCKRQKSKARISQTSNNLSDYFIKSRRQVVNQIQRQQSTKDKKFNEQITTKKQNKTNIPQNKTVFHLTNLSNSYFSIYLDEWYEGNKQLPPSILSHILLQYLQKTPQYLARKLPNIEITSLYSLDKKIKWSEMFKSITQVFDKNVVLSRIKDKTDKQKYRILLVLNKILLSLGNTFQRYQLPKLLFQSEKATIPLLFQDLQQVIMKFFSTKKLSYIRLGVQLLLLFQCRQRIPSMIPMIEDCVKKCLINNSYSTKITAKKTKIIQQFIIGEQLLFLMKKIKWKGFSQKIRFYQRLSNYLPFSLYCLRKGLFCFLALHQNDIQDLKKFTLHSSKKSLEHYLKNVRNHIYHSFINNHFQLPFIKQYQQKHQYRRKIQNFNKVKLPGNWFDIFQQKAGMFMSQDQFQVLENQYKPQSQNQQVIAHIQQNCQIDIQQILDEQNQINQSQIVTIRDFKYIIKNDQFNFMEIFNEVNHFNCIKCLNKTQRIFQCRFCSASFHKECIETFCICFHDQNRQQQYTLKVISSKKSKIKFKMPPSYLGNKRMLNQMKFCIYLRGYHFTNVPIPSKSLLKINKLSLEDFDQLQNVQLPLYDDYKSQNYFPPIRLGLFGNQSIEGSGFGLYALESIERYTFIGIYAADLILKKQTINVRRLDCIINLANNIQFSYNSLFIAPVNYFGYTLLINQDKTRPNCAFKKCLVNQQLQIIVITTLKIHKNQQLLLDYDTGFNQTGVVQDNLPIYFDENISTEKYIKISNISNNCYLNVSLQLLKVINPFFYADKDEKKQLFIELHKFYNSRQIYNPKQLLNIIYKEGEFQPHVQYDFTQAFQFLVQSMEEIQDHQNNFHAHFKTQTQCIQCHNITVKQDKIIFIVCQQIFQTQKKLQLNDFVCEKCSKKGKAICVQTYKSFQRFIIIIIERFSKQNIFKKKFIFKESILEIQGNKYQKCILILHYGETIKQGHYAFVNLNERIYISDQTIRNKFEIRQEDIYAIIFKRI